MLGAWAHGDLGTRGERPEWVLEPHRGLLHLAQLRLGCSAAPSCSPQLRANLFVDKAWHIKVGDFNLSRYMARDSQFVKSTLENNPRWSAPEVIREGK
jgi:hypothetical protein